MAQVSSRDFFELASDQFDSSKFRELIVYVAQESADDQKFGAVELNKLLYFSDFEAYAKWGAPITGARYQRLRWGPAPRALLPVRAELVDEEAIRLDTADYGGYPQERVVALRVPDLDRFSPAEVRLVDDVIERYRGLDGTEISNVSHEAPGWQLARDREDIPYFTVLIAPEQPPADVKREAAELAERHGWLAASR
jgi:hypothetical protein